MNFSNFIETYAPDANCIPLDKAIIEKYRDIVPESMLSFWSEAGTGKYGKGLIEIINPEEYRNTLETWLGKKVPNYVPIALSAFGELFYYRRLTENDEDVCCLDPHYRKISTCVWDVDSFFNDYLTDSELSDEKLRKELFESSSKKLGAPGVGEIFMFVPALCIGGGEELKFIEKGNAIIHLDILFQMR